MSVRYIPGPVIDQPNVVLRGVTLFSIADRVSSATNYHVVSVGFQSGEFTTWIGAWDQSTNKANAGESLRVLDDKRIGMRIPDGSAIVVKVTQVGAPVSIDNAKIDVTLGLVGGRAGDVKPLVSVGQGIADANAKAAGAALSRQINSGGLSEWTEPIYLFDPDGTADEPAFEAENSYTTTDKSIVAGAGATASDVSITFTKPSWATTGYVNVTAFVDALGAGGGVGALDIHDGTTAHNTIQFSIANTFATSSGTGYAGEITATTTFTLRGTATTANMTLQESLIYGTCSWA